MLEELKYEECWPLDFLMISHRNHKSLTFQGINYFLDFKHDSISESWNYTHNSWYYYHQLILLCVFFLQRAYLYLLHSLKVCFSLFIQSSVKLLYFWSDFTLQFTLVTPFTMVGTEIVPPVTRLHAGQLRKRESIPSRGKKFLSSPESAGLAATRRIFMKFTIWALFSKIFFTGSLHDDVYIFMIPSRWVLLRMKNVQGKFV